MPSGQGGKPISPPLPDILPSSAGQILVKERKADINLPAGTNPIHNKKPKKKAAELDEDDLAFKAKQAAGASPSHFLLPGPRTALSACAIINFEGI